jgi:hypothetical protein
LLVKSAQHRLDGGFEGRKIAFHDAPDHSMVEAVLAVPEDIADAGHVGPRDLGVLGLEVGWNASPGFR